MKYLGETFEIYGVRDDPIFPHHGNKIARSEGAARKPFTRYWIHNGRLLLGKGRGIRRTVIELCDGVARIPMAGSIGFLNLSVVAGIVLYETFRRSCRMGG